MLVEWLERTLIDHARQLSAGETAFPHFDTRIAEALRKNPIQAWEADRWMRGVKLRLIRVEGHFFRVGAGKRSALSLFVRNDQGKNVGLRRESITQMATFMTLATDYGYGRRATRFESRWMDVAVYGDEGRPYIYAENKASVRVLDKLCARLSLEFAESVPPLMAREDGRVVDDPLAKANHIWLHRPVYFWAVCPTDRHAFRVVYGENGFRLTPIPDIPRAESKTSVDDNVIPGDHVKRRARVCSDFTQSRV